MSLIILTSHQAAMYTKAVTLTARCQASASDTPGFDANPDYEAFWPSLLEPQNEDYTFIFTPWKYVMEYGKASLLFPRGNLRI